MLVVTISAPFQYDYTVRTQILRGTIRDQGPSNGVCITFQRTSLSTRDVGRENQTSYLMEVSFLCFISWATESSSLMLSIVASAFFIRLLRSSLEGTGSNQEENEERLYSA